MVSERLRRRRAAMVLVSVAFACAAPPLPAPAPAVSAAVMRRADADDPNARLVQRFESGERYLRVVDSRSWRVTTLSVTDRAGRVIKRVERQEWIRRAETMHEILATDRGAVTRKRVHHPFVKSLLRTDDERWSEYREPLHECVVLISTDGDRPEWTLEKGSADDRELTSVGLRHAMEEALLPRSTVRVGDRWTPDLEAVRGFLNLEDECRLTGECRYTAENLEGEDLIGVVSMEFEVAGRFGQATIEEFRCEGRFEFSHQRHRVRRLEFHQQGRQSVPREDGKANVEWAVDWMISADWENGIIVTAPLGFQDDPRRSDARKPGSNPAPPVSSLSDDSSRTLAPE